MLKRSVLLLIGLLFLFFGYFYFQKTQTKLVSPVLGVSTLSFADNIWFPKEDKKLLSLQKTPEVTAKAAFFVDTQTGEVLYEKNAHEKLPIASLVKIMTVIVTLEGNPLSKEMVVSKHAAEMEPDKMLLKEGETMTVEELLDGIFLVSANDAAEVLAESLPTGRQGFINLMNAEALHLGMRDTNFINPTGLEEDGVNQESTAFDVALMSRFLITKWPQVLKISSREHIYLDLTQKHQDYDLYSGINLLTTYPGVIGLKTGYTPEAGLTLVTLARKSGREVLGVLLGATDRRDDAKALLNYSFTRLGILN